MSISKYNVISITNWRKEGNTKYHRSIADPITCKRIVQVISVKTSKTTGKPMYTLYEDLFQQAPKKIARFNNLVNAVTFANRLISELWIK